MKKKEKKRVHKRLPFSFVFRKELNMMEKRCRSSSKLLTDSFQFPQVSLVNCTAVCNAHTKCVQRRQKQSMRFCGKQINEFARAFGPKGFNTVLKWAEKNT